MILLSVASWLLPRTTAAQTPVVAGPDRVVDLVAGGEMTLTPGFAIGNVAVGNPAVCDIRVLPGRRDILLLAQGEGTTLLTLWDQSGGKRDEIQITVAARNVSQLASDLTNLLEPYPGVRPERLGARLVLMGTVPDDRALASVQAIAQAAGVTSLVTVGPVTALPVSPASAADRPATPRPMMATDAALPVALTSAEPERPREERERASALPTVAVLADDDGPPPTAVPSPPPPNVFHVPAGGRPGDSLGFGSGLAPREAPDRPASRGEAGAPGPAVGSPSDTPSRVDYRIDIFEQSALAPPPEVVRPQGTPIFGTTIGAYDGRTARELIVADRGGTEGGVSRPMSGLSIEVRPSIQGGSVATSMTIDTNLPLGSSRGSGPQPWRRAQVSFSVQAGATRYLTEQELSSLLTGPPTPAPVATGLSGPGAGAAIAAVGDAVGQVGYATGNVEAQMAPAIGGLFRLGGGGGSTPQPQAAPPAGSDRRLVIAVSPVLASER